VIIDELPVNNSTSIFSKRTSLETELWEGRTKKDVALDTCEEHMLQAYPGNMSPQCCS
jgi:hypothetical protein